MIPAEAFEGVDAEHPWPGLVPFTEAIQAYFHGRDSEAAELLRLIKREPLTVLFGQSGLGKSSLLSAGLFPRLRRDDFLPVYIRLEVAPSAPALGAQVKTILAENLRAHGVDARLPREDETLWAYFHEAETDFWSARNRLLTPVLVLDQFEEIFTLGRHSDEMQARCRAFVGELGDLIENRMPESVVRQLEENPDLASRFDFSKRNCKVLLAFREDFLPDFEGLRREIRSIMQNRMRLTRMNGAQALEAITQSGGHLIASGVAGRIISFVAGPRAGGDATDGIDVDLTSQEIEPALLSLVCRELNNKRIAASRAQITGDLLEAGVQQEIISNFYERSLANLDPGVRVFVEDQLLTEAGYRDSYALDDARRLPGVTQEAIDTLVARRLLRLDERFGVLRIELTHDVLTRVVRDSRDQRQVREARALRLQQDLARRQRTRRIVGIGVAAGAGMLGLAIVFAVLMQRAVVEKNRVVETQSNVLVTQANISLENRTPRDPQAYLAKAIRLNPNNDAATARVVTLVHQRRYPVHLGERPLPDQLSRADIAWLDAGRIILGDRVITAADPYRVWRLTDIEQGDYLLARRVAALSMGYAPKDKAGAIRFDLRAHAFVRWGTTADTDENYTQVFDAKSMKRVSAFRKIDAMTIQALSHDGRAFATQTKDQGLEVRVDDTAPPRRILLPEAQRSLLTMLEFSPDSSGLLTWFSDGNATLFDTRSGTVQWTQKLARSAVMAERGSFSPGGRWLVTVTGATVRLHDARTGAAHGKTLMHAAPVNGVSFSHDGEHLLTACQDQAARVWHSESTSLVAPPLMHDGPVVSARFSADKRYVLTASLDGTARIFSIAGESLVEPLLHDAAVIAAEFSPDGSRVASVSDDGRLHLWQPDHTQRALGAQSAHGTLDHGAPVTALAASADGSRIATGTARGEVRLWKMNANPGGEAATTLERRFPAHTEPITGLAFNSRGTRLATVSGDGTARVWDAGTGAAAGKPLRHRGAVRSVRFGGDDEWLLTTADDHSARLWSVRHSAPLGLSMRHGGPVMDAELARDGRIVATASGTEVRIWDAATGALLTRLQHAAPVTSLSVSPDATEVIAASGQKIALWKLESGNRARQVRNTPDASRDARNLVWVVRHSRDGTRFASGGIDGFVQVWAREGLLPVGAPMKHNALVTRIEFSADDRWLTTSARDRAVRVWDTRGGQLIADPLRHDHDVSGFAAMAGHAWLATGAADGKLRLWRLGLGYRGAPPDWVAPMVEVLGGAQIDDSGALVLIDRRDERLLPMTARLNSSTTDVLWTNWAREALTAFQRMPAGVPLGEKK